VRGFRVPAVVEDYFGGGVGCLGHLTVDCNTSEHVTCVLWHRQPLLCF
jgi:hypothetical protein